MLFNVRAYSERAGASAGVFYPGKRAHGMILLESLSGGEYRKSMEYLSFSRLSLLETCGLRFYFEYVEKRSPVDPVPLHHAKFGTLLHSLYEQHANSAGHDSYEVLKKRYDVDFPKLVSLFPDRDAAVQFYKKGLAAIQRFSRYLVKDVVASEKEFLIETSTGVPPLKGFIDRLIYSEDHGYLVADLKTGKAFSGGDRKKRRQLVVYSIACESEYGTPADSGYFDFVVQGNRAWVDIAEEDRAEVRAWVREKWHEIEMERFDAKYSRAFCSAYCPFRSECDTFLQHHRAG
ncbi:hypothetical protein AYW79_12340 [Ferroacidibacillus organovorans]|uniref:PD-(D/E)XK endonuclease-like domain-containing protein n=1 Tax=Ferroacidibacillus organovorans TaxID=1765683 RepID=A0A853K9S6_9BACL|nr:hypothetical protein AYJ22_08590 [Ferroacidibacillus organovorans]OAG93094.1 hypothetical protein AYW79_12340 [Ferroacidibacillus organovorans]